MVTQHEQLTVQNLQLRKRTRDLVNKRGIEVRSAKPFEKLSPQQRTTVKNKLERLFADTLSVRNFVKTLHYF